ncbi:MAG: UDP-2,3-diacylglucosamine diphosphatase [Cyclobacteriaceae bacterium]
MQNCFSQIPKGKKIYIASDFHIGAPNRKESLLREKKIITWLSQIEDTAHGIILAGDVFDFWFEYKTVVPKGAIRLLGKLAELSDSGIPIAFFAGNHDLWLKDYLSKELGAIIYHNPVSFQTSSMKVMIGHGDGLGPGDRKFKILKRIFTAGFNRALFRWLHPDIGVRLANAWSSRSKKKAIKDPESFLDQKEMLFQYCQSIEKESHHDFYIFGHRHMHLEMPINKNAIYINIGDWVNLFTYAEIDDKTVNVKRFED